MPHILSDAVVILIVQEYACDQGQSLHIEIHQLVRNFPCDRGQSLHIEIHQLVQNFACDRGQSLHIEIHQLVQNTMLSKYYAIFPVKKGKWTKVIPADALVIINTSPYRVSWKFY
jgi:hypothetical protein